MKAGPKQSLFDMALQHGGDCASAFDIAEANGMSMTDDLQTGQLLTLPSMHNAQVAQYYEVGRFKPATSITTDEQSASPYGGIDYMGIEYDFIVS